MKTNPPLPRPRRRVSVFDAAANSGRMLVERRYVKTARGSEKLVLRPHDTHDTHNTHDTPADSGIGSANICMADICRRVVLSRGRLFRRTLFFRADAAAVVEVGAPVFHPNAARGKCTRTCTVGVTIPGAGRRVLWRGAGLRAAELALASALPRTLPEIELDTPPERRGLLYLPWLAAGAALTFLWARLTVGADAAGAPGGAFRGTFCGAVPEFAFSALFAAVVVFCALRGCGEAAAVQYAATSSGLRLSAGRVELCRVRGAGLRVVRTLLRRGAIDRAEVVRTPFSALTGLCRVKMYAAGGRRPFVCRLLPERRAAALFARLRSSRAGSAAGTHFSGC